MGKKRKASPEPKPLPPPAPSFFQGSCIHFSCEGMHPRRLAVWQKQVIQKHGKCSAILDTGCTHLICGSLKSVLEKYEWHFLHDLVAGSKLTIVHYDWLIQCLTHCKTMDIEPYLQWDPIQNAPQIFEGLSLFFVPPTDRVCEIKWSICRCQVERRGGKANSDMCSSEATHIVALEWLDIADSGRCKYLLYKHSGQYVDFQWFVECVTRGELLDSSEYDIMLGKEETSKLITEKHAYWDAQN